MKKKICLLLCALMTMLCFAGCSAKEKTTTPDTTTMEQVAEAILSSFAAMADTDFEQFESMSDYQLNYTMMASSLPIDAEDFRGMMKSWKAAEKENGEYLQHGKYEVEVKNDGVVLSTEVKFEEKDATVLFNFDEDSNLESLDVSAKLTTGEIMKKAGLNTILGMGTVFVVLIFLAFLIYLMKFIPALLGQDESNWSKPEEIEPIPMENEEVSEAGVAYIDDLELVAVITAAIAAQEGKSADGFVVRSIRRRPSNHWN